MKLNNKGQGMAFYTLEAMIVIFIVVLVYAVLNDVMVNDILTAGYDMSPNKTAYNESMDRIEMGWTAFPWVLIFSYFLFLLMVALMRGR